MAPAQQSDSSAVAPVSQSDDNPQAPEVKQAPAPQPSVQVPADASRLAPASEQPALERSPKDPKTLFVEANELYLAGQYAEAIELYREIYRLTEEPALLFNIAHCYRLLRDCEAASATFKIYQAAAHGGDPSKKDWLAGLTAECSAPVETTPPITGVRPAAETAPSVHAPSTRSNSPDAAPAPGLAQESEIDRISILGYGLVGAGVLAASGAVWFGLAAAQTEHDLEALATPLEERKQSWDEQAQGLSNKGHQQQLWSVGFGIGAAVLTGAGIVLLALPREESLPLQVSIGSRGSMATYRLHF